tara:strand:- start:73 stop:339 length:267 start_codon:yes stop_codon:yes gene_type:complete
MAKKGKKEKKQEKEEVVEEELIEEEAPVEEPVLEVQEEQEPPRCFWKQHEKPNKYFRVNGEEYPEADVEEVEHPTYKLKDGTEFTIVN